MNKADLPSVALIAGPTASGKSALALALADLTPAVIVNGDASQVYRDLRVLSARPSDADEARHPHRLFGHVDGAEGYSAALWAAEARVAIREAHEEQRLPILVGGTGLYLRTLLDGIAPVPEIDQTIRAEVRALPVEDAHWALSREDPDAAERLARTDSTRVARALEVVRSTGAPLASWQRQREGGIGAEIDLKPLILLPPRDWLYAHCDARFAAMVRDGAEAEVRALLARTLDPALPVMRAIGVREIAALIEGRLSRDEAIAAGQAATRQYAKRQYTWFRHQPPADWTRAHEQHDSDVVQNLVIKLHKMTLTA